MKQSVFISIYLDTRRPKSSGKYPVRLRVFRSTPRKQKLYPTTFDFTEKEFESIWNTSKPRNQHKEIRNKLQHLELRAIEVAESLNTFTFEKFEGALYKEPGNELNVNGLYQAKIDVLLSRDQVSTASSYDLSRKSIEAYIKAKTTQKYDRLSLSEITTEWLHNYESYMTKDRGLSITTVGIYLRTLRAIFNTALDNKDLEKELYPFGIRKYQIPTTKNTKRALSKEQLKLLLQAKPHNDEQRKARDFWFFSYSCNGMNLKDIANLKYRNIKGDKIEFKRAKTIRTSKKEIKPITVYLNEFSLEIIARYGTPHTSPDNLVFDIISDKMSAAEKRNKVNNFNRFIGQHLKKLCKEIGLPTDVSAYWARHSFATNAVRKGATLEFIQESLGHGSIKTTQSYFAGFDNDTKKEFANTIMNFD